MSWEYREIMVGIRETAVKGGTELDFTSGYASSTTQALGWVRDLGYNVEWTCPKGLGIKATITW